MSQQAKIILGAIALIAVFYAGYAFFFNVPQAGAPTPNEAPQPAETEAMTAEDESELSEGTARYDIDPESSEVRFKIDEVLRGEPFTVIGTTSIVSGHIDLNRENPLETQIRTIQVDAESLRTDDTRRDGMISRFILQSTRPENRFITFEPKRISILTDQILVGETYEIDITGDLTVRGTTEEVDFTGTFILEDENTLVGSASGTILYEDYGIEIPSVPFVASVEDEVVLEIDFTATN